MTSREELDELTKAGVAAVIASAFGEDQRASYWWDIVSIALDRGMLPLLEARSAAAHRETAEAIAQAIDGEADALPCPHLDEGRWGGLKRGAALALETAGEQ